MRPFVYERAASADDALRMHDDGALYLGGGTNLVDLMRLGVEEPARLVDVSRLPYDGIELRPVLAASFGCPCHGGLYDSEGNRSAGPPVRSLDRFEFSIKDGNLILGRVFSVGNVEGTGAKARISKYYKAYPGVHVDGIEKWLYPIPTPGSTG